jgi:aminoglycoside phosphotransferase family enzyme/predicted kinase
MPAQPTSPSPEALQLVQQLQQQLGARLIETHISWVLLDGQFAWKIKKPVRLPFLDFSTLATRQRLCREELRLNRRLAPAVYLDVVPISGSAQQPLIHGQGPAIEYALRMKQFPPGALMAEQLAAGTLRPEHLDKLAQSLAAFHRDAHVAGPESAGGHPERIEGAVNQVMAGLHQQGCTAECAALAPWLAAQAEHLRPLWQQRLADGHVREGHGDLHLANVVLLGDEVTAFDCIEFDPALRWGDVITDIAFLVMDLMAHGRADLAFRFLNAYLDLSGDHAGLPLLRHALVYRALVRALVARLHPRQGDEPAVPDYLALALSLTHPASARLLITHGLSGSGKSVLTQSLLQQAQAIRLRSDIERQRTAPPGVGRYSPEARQRTYARLRDLAHQALLAGYPVIVDATFLKAADRSAFKALALEHQVPFAILHCLAPQEALRQRIGQRLAQGTDASEASLSVLEAQQAEQEPLTVPEQAHTLVADTTSPVDMADIVRRWA